MTPIAAAVFVVCLAPQESPGFPTREAQQALQARDFAGLEQISLARVTGNSGDSLGWFYLGYARAAQGKFGASVTSYQEAIRLGLKDFKCFYQLGFSANRAGLHTIAETALVQAVALKPQDPDALYYLGLSQMEIFDCSAAEETFGRLIPLKSKWTEAARFQRAVVRMKLRRKPEAEVELRAILQESQDEDLKRRSWELLKEPAAPAPRPAAQEKRWTVAWYEKGGYDSNVLFLPDTAQSRPTGEDDFFLMTFFMGAVDLVEEKRLTARLNLLDLSYPQLREFSINAVLASVESTVPLQERLFVDVSGHGELYLLDRDSFFNRVGARGTLRYEITEQTQVAFGGSFMIKDFRQRAYEEFNSEEQGGYLELRLKKLVAWLDGSIRYDLLREDADAGDLSYVEHRLGVKAEARFGGPWVGRLEGWVRFREYDKADRTFGEVREDRRTGIRATLVYQVHATLQVFAEVEVEAAHSSLPAFAFDRRQFAVGTLLVF